MAAKESQATEQTPLLREDDDDDGQRSTTSASSSPADDHDNALLEQGLLPKSPDVKPFFPKRQIMLLCYARMTEPIAFFSIFPFVAQMVQRNGRLPESDVGFYSGIIESVFSVSMTIVLLFWGRLADRAGRKPVLVYCLCGTAVGPAMFGMATSIGQMIAFRCLAGVFAGSGLVIRTMIGDLCTPETQALGFSWFAFANNMGILLGTFVGGALTDPVNQYPAVFAGNAFFEKYPYALQGFVVGAISASAAVTSILFVEETLVRKEASPPPPPPAEPGNGSVATRDTVKNDDDPGSMSVWQLIRAPGVAPVLWIYAHVMLLAFAFTAILPVFLFTSVRIGGLAFSSFQISMYMAVQGASQAIWLLLVFPFLQRRMGTRGVMRLCAFMYPLFFAGFIVMNSLLRVASPAAMVWFWIVGPVVAIVGPGVAMSFTVVQLALNDVSPAAQLLGTLNAIAMTFASATRSLVPGVATAVYAVGVRYQILWGHLAWVILIPMAMALLPSLRWLRSDK